MKKISKRILYAIPLMIGIVLIYGIFSGKLDERVNRAKAKLDEKKTDTVQNDTSPGDVEGGGTGETSLPEGKIALKENFMWEIPPRVDEYDPENKISGNYVYGSTLEEQQYKTKCGKEQNDIDMKEKIPAELKGDQIFNKEKMIQWGETFEIKYNQLTCKYDNPVIRDDLAGLDEKYYSYDKELLLDKLDADGKLQNVSIWEWNEDREHTNVRVKLVMFDITITPHSNWVTECEVVPELLYLEEKNGALFSIDDEKKYYNRSGELHVIHDRPIYYDLGLYDFETAGINEDIYYCPMRKGEIINFTVGYLVPEELLDYAYVVYNPDCHRATDYSYNTRDIAIKKLMD